MINNDSEIGEAFLVSLNVESLRLTNLPNFVFFCGGLQGERDVEGTLIPNSMRSAVLKKLVTCTSRTFSELNSNIILAEEFEDWLHYSNVSNLIDFEIPLAELARMVVLILEGPGAYAELGSFCVLNSIQKKLITIVNTESIPDGSFINHGPLKYLEEKGEQSPVVRLNWRVTYKANHNIISSSLSDSIHDIYETSQIIVDTLAHEYEKRNVISPKIDIKNPGHQALIIADLIYLFSGLIIKEIRENLKYIYKLELSNEKIKELIYILICLRFVRKSEITNGSSVYYVSTENNSGFIKYSYNELKNEFKFSSSGEVKGRLLAWYKSNDKFRFRAITTMGEI